MKDDNEIVKVEFVDLVRANDYSRAVIEEIGYPEDVLKEILMKRCFDPNKHSVSSVKNVYVEYPNCVIEFDIKLCVYSADILQDLEDIKVNRKKEGYILGFQIDKELCDYKPVNETLMKYYEEQNNKLKQEKKGD